MYAAENVTIQFQHFLSKHKLEKEITHQTNMRWIHCSARAILGFLFIFHFIPALVIRLTLWFYSWRTAQTGKNSRVYVEIFCQFEMILNQNHNDDRIYSVRLTYMVSGQWSICIQANMNCVVLVQCLQSSALLWALTWDEWQRDNGKAD